LHRLARSTARRILPAPRVWPTSTSIANQVEAAGLAIERLRCSLAKLPVGYRFLPLTALASEFADILSMAHEAELHFHAHGLDDRPAD
jgi:hypothetical protein